jgi:UDP-N-acetylmuramoyl-L-alanyl-D-glutamate--2,6-diaminopimelate ligase
MVDAGVSHCVLEATSHGLAQERVGAIDFDLAVVTNITHEHLDYHGDYESYFAAKEKLFRRLGIGDRGSGTCGTKTAVLNADDGSYKRLARIAVERWLVYGLDGDADVSAEEIRYGPGKTEFNLLLPGAAPEPVSARLVGRFNVYNMLAAAAAAYGLGIEPQKIVQGLAAVEQLEGRMQGVERGQPFQVVVDFAHTPNALEQAIGAARAMLAPDSGGRVIVVFGSAGKRDVEKRRLMAEIAAREADLTVLTAEDPRTESLDDILAMMADGCRSQGGVEGETFWRERDRGRAIYFALGLARAADVVLVCGKGHEQSMCFGAVEYPWDDVQAATVALDAFLAGRPMVDLGLPTFGDEDDEAHQSDE